MHASWAGGNLPHDSPDEKYAALVESARPVLVYFADTALAFLEPPKSPLTNPANLGQFVVATGTTAKPLRVPQRLCGNAPNLSPLFDPGVATVPRPLTPRPRLRS